MIAVTTSLHLMRGKWDLHDFSAALSDYIQSNMQKDLRGILNTDERVDILVGAIRFYM